MEEINWYNPCFVVALEFGNTCTRINSKRYKSHTYWTPLIPPARYIYRDGIIPCFCQIDMYHFSDLGFKAAHRTSPVVKSGLVMSRHGVHELFKIYHVNKKCFDIMCRKSFFLIISSNFQRCFVICICHANN